MSKDRTINWKIAVVVLVILSAIIAFAGGYVYTEYRNLRTTKLEIEAENRRLKSDVEDKEASILIFRDSLEVLGELSYHLSSKVSFLNAELDSVKSDYEDLLVEIEDYDYREQVRLFNRQTGPGTPATLVEHSSDTIVMTPVPRIEIANRSMIREHYLDKRVEVQDSVISYQRQQIRVMQNISATQALMIEDKREIIDIQNRRIENQEDLIKELDSHYAIRRWRSTAIGVGVGIIIGLIL